MANHPKKIWVPSKKHESELFKKKMGDPMESKEVKKPPVRVKKEESSFAFMDLFIIVSCVAFGAALTVGYLMYSGTINDKIKTVVQKEMKTLPGSPAVVGESPQIDPAMLRAAVSQALSEDSFKKLLGSSGGKARDGVAGPRGLQGLQGPPGPQGPPGTQAAAGKSSALNGVAGWEMLESKTVQVPLGQKKTVFMSCSSGKILLGGGYNAAGCKGCSVETNYPSSTNSWETTLLNQQNSKAINLKVYVTCAEPTLPK